MRKVLRPKTFGLLILIALHSGAWATSQPQFIDNTPIIDDSPENENTPSVFFPLAEEPAAKAPRSEIPLRLDSPQAMTQWLPIKTKILNDFGTRMTPEFAIPEGLRLRTAFWFDIYARYGANHYVVHHVLYPWIVYRVIDVTSYVENGRGPQWLRRERAEKSVKAQVLAIRQNLQRLSRRTSFAKLPAGEQELYDDLLKVPGSRLHVLREAAQNVRTQLGQRDFYERGLITSSRYLPYMEEEFRRRGLPTELTRLPFVESSFNEDARSRVGASGVWQIMPRTGRAYLTVTDLIDERNSPLKATVAAARLLRSYFRAEGSWALAITSYNNGIGNIQKAIRAAKSRDLVEIIARYHRGDFRFASSNYYACFLAALYAEKYNELVFKDVPREPLREREPLRLARATHTLQLSRLVGATNTDLLNYNLDLKMAFKKNALLPKGHVLYLPPGRHERLVERKERLRPES